jgi:hypothetical protein
VVADRFGVGYRRYGLWYQLHVGAENVIHVL